MALGQPCQTPALREPHSAVHAESRHFPSEDEAQGATFTLIQAEECSHTRATKHGEKLFLDGKPEPGVMSHDRHESGIFTSSIAPNFEVGILCQDSIAK